MKTMDSDPDAHNDANNMELSRRTREQLAVEGITVPEDFKEFNEEGMKGIFANLFKPPKVPVTGAAARAAGTLREIQAYDVSAKSKMRLNGAMLIAKFYDDVGRPLDPDNMSWPVIKHFFGAVEGPDGEEEGRPWATPQVDQEPSRPQITVRFSI